MEPTVYSGQDMGMFSGVWMIIWLVLVVVGVVAQWKIFEKAGRPGWYCLIPFYNLFKMFEVAGMSGWWLLALFVPFLNLVAIIMLAVNLAHAFGKSTAYGIFLLFFLSGIGYLMLAFGDAKYQLGAGKTSPAVAS